MRIIFVCTGNTCRSPMAEMAAKFLIAGHEFSSAGMLALEGSPVSAKAILALENAGIPCEAHLSRNLRADDIRNADVILTMTGAMKRNFPKEVGSKVFTLKEYVGEKGDIADPFGGSIKDYEKCLEDILLCIRKLKERLK